MASEVELLTQELIRFRDARDWAQFHSIRNLTVALSVEAAELQEALLWKSDEDVQQLLKSAGRQQVSNELADVFIYAFLLAHSLGEDPIAIVRSKLALNAERYPVHLAKGNARKHNELK